MTLGETGETTDEVFNESIFTAYMNQAFLNRLQECGQSKSKLLDLMSSLDEEKRSLKSRLSRLSSEPDGKFGRGRERQVQIRKIKDRNSFLTEERETVRSKLGSLKMDGKALNRARQVKPDFCQAFMAAAERELSPEMFLDIECRAGEIIAARYEAKNSTKRGNK